MENERRVYKLYKQTSVHIVGIFIFIQTEDSVRVTTQQLQLVKWSKGYQITKAARVQIKLKAMILCPHKIKFTS